MKKLLLVSILALAVSAQAAVTTTVTLGANAISNLSTIVSAPFKVTVIDVKADTATNTAVQVFDTTNVGLTNVVAGYPYNQLYATNYITAYTNYYGVSTSLTNVALITLSNYVASVTNTLSPKYSLTAPASSTVEYGPMDVWFYGGIVVSNTTTAPATVTIGYTQ